MLVHNKVNMSYSTGIIHIDLTNAEILCTIKNVISDQCTQLGLYLLADVALDQVVSAVGKEVEIVNRCTLNAITTQKCIQHVKEWNEFDYECVKYSKQYAREHNININSVPHELIAVVVMLNIGIDLFQELEDCRTNVYFWHCFTYASKNISTNSHPSIFCLLCTILIRRMSNKCKEALSMNFGKSVQELIDKLQNKHFESNIFNRKKLPYQDVYFCNTFCNKQVNYAYNIWAYQHCDKIITQLKERCSRCRSDAICTLYAVICDEYFAICDDVINPWTISSIFCIVEALLQIHEPMYKHQIRKTNIHIRRCINTRRSADPKCIRIIRTGSCKPCCDVDSVWFNYRRYLDPKCFRIIRTAIFKFQQHWMNLYNYYLQLQSNTNKALLKRPLSCDATVKNKNGTVTKITTKYELDDFECVYFNKISIAANDAGVESWNRLFRFDTLTQLLIGCGLDTIRGVLFMKNKHKKNIKLRAQLDNVQSKVYPKIARYLYRYVLSFIQPFIQMIVMNPFLLELDPLRHRLIPSLAIAVESYAYMGNHQQAAASLTIFDKFLFNTPNSFEWYKRMCTCPAYQFYCNCYQKARRIVLIEKRALKPVLERLVTMASETEIINKISDDHELQLNGGMTMSMSVMENVLSKQGFKNLSMIKECYYCRKKNKKLLKCKGCGKAKYCCRKCQKQDWNLRNHKYDCIKCI